jgi:hypothetical protein
MASATAARRRPRDPAVSNAARLANLLDTRFTIPGTRIRFGLDPLLGLVPGFGDTISLILSLVIVAEARDRGVGMAVIARMIFNCALDWLVGLVPVVGDVFDLFYKANVRNLRLLERELRRQEQGGLR